MDLARLGYQKRKHRVLLAPTPESKTPSNPAIPAVSDEASSSTQASTAPTLTPSAAYDPLPTLNSPVNLTSNSPTTAKGPGVQGHKRRREEATILREEWKQLYWFRGHRMEAILEDYGSSYDVYHNKRRSRRLAQQLFLTAG